MTIIVDLQNTTPSNHYPNTDLMKKWVALVLKNRMENAELTIRIVEPNEMSKLNEQFRQKQGPTNVLSFPIQLHEVVELDPPLLGDIIVCGDVIEQEAIKQQKSNDAHWAHIIIHGTLHLLGYDHVEINEANKMEALEIAYLEQLGYPNPYEHHTTTL